MRPILSRLLVGVLAGGLLPAAAAADSLTPIGSRSALAVAKVYAADRTLVFYCLRQSPEMTPFTYLIVHSELQDAIVKLKSAGSNAQQNAELAQTVLTDVHFPKPGVSDPALEAECKARNVEESFYTFTGSFSVSLAARPPFKDLTR